MITANWCKFWCNHRHYLFRFVLSISTWLYTFIVVFTSLCPSKYCLVLISIPASAYLVHVMWRNMCGEILGSCISLVSFILTIRCRVFLMLTGYRFLPVVFDKKIKFLYPSTSKSGSFFIESQIFLCSQNIS